MLWTTCMSDSAQPLHMVYTTSPWGVCFLTGSATCIEQRNHPYDDWNRRTSKWMNLLSQQSLKPRKKQLISSTRSKQRRTQGAIEKNLTRRVLDDRRWCQKESHHIIIGSSQLPMCASRLSRSSTPSAAHTASSSPISSSIWKVSRTKLGNREVNANQHINIGHTNHHPACQHHENQAPKYLMLHGLPCLQLSAILLEECATFQGQQSRLGSECILAKASTRGTSIFLQHFV